MSETKIMSGNILIAEPFLMGGPFKRSVVTICEHRQDGTVGFILNRKMDMKVSDLIDEFPEFEGNVYYGGPVDTDTIHFIHNVAELIDGSTEIVKGLYWGGDFERIKFLISTKLIESKNIKFFIGYCGWSEGQLEDELNSGSWIVDEMFSSYAFKEYKDGLWSKVLNNKGDRYSVIANMSDFPSYN